MSTSNVPALRGFPAFANLKLVVLAAMGTANVERNEEQSRFAR